MLDITGCDHPFGGERRLAADVEARLARLRRARAPRASATRPTPRARSARFQARPAPDEHAPCSACRSPRCELDERRPTALRRAGLKTVGDLAGAPAAPARRALRRRSGDRAAPPARRVPTARIAPPCPPPRSSSNAASPSRSGAPKMRLAVLARTARRGGRRARAPPRGRAPLRRAAASAATASCAAARSRPAGRCAIRRCSMRLFRERIDSARRSARSRLRLRHDPPGRAAASSRSRATQLQARRRRGGRARAVDALIDRLAHAARAQRGSAASRRATRISPSRPQLELPADRAPRRSATGPRPKPASRRCARSTCSIRRSRSR